MPLVTVLLRAHAAAALLLAAAHAAHAQERAPVADRLPAGLVSLVSCNDARGDGSYRVAVFSRGFEHVSSEVHLQWIAWAEDGPRVIASVPVSELSTGTWSVAPPRPVPGKSCAWRIDATHTYTQAPARVVLRPVRPGQYAIQGMPAASSGR